MQVAPTGHDARHDETQRVPPDPRGTQEVRALCQRKCVTTSPVAGRRNPTGDPRPTRSCPAQTRTENTKTSRSTKTASSTQSTRRCSPTSLFTFQAPSHEYHDQPLRLPHVRISEHNRMRLRRASNSSRKGGPTESPPGYGQRHRLGDQSQAGGGKETQIEASLSWY